MSDNPEVIDVRPGEELALDGLEPWLRETLGAEGEITVRQFGGGHANLTYLLTIGGTDYVLRRPPLGPVAASAHDMAREHRILSRLWQAYPLAPKSLARCTDTSLIGAEFHLLERRRGFVIRSGETEKVLADPAIAKGVSETLVDCLADLHVADPAVAGLEDLGHPEGFMERQVSGWTCRWKKALDPDAPDARPLIDWIAARIPKTSPAQFVHNDYKLDNVLLDDADPTLATAVLDWDMCTRGDPLSDLGTLMNYWLEPGDPDDWRIATGMPCEYPGFLTRDAALERYARRTGFDLSQIVWFQVFAAFRTAVILQQIFIRWLRGQTRDARFERFGRRVAALIAKAEHLSRTAR
jgi:aminoglycoside phosphotransferase (APT) family kinase protein